MDALVRAVDSPIRREILRLVWAQERTAGEIASHFDVTFGAVSQHLARLREAGCVVRRVEGRRRFYRADTEALAPVHPVLQAFWTARLLTLARLAEAEAAEESR